ncbi:MAG: DEAD/DEAH box helicase [Pirellulales bacterium]|nr:DEAD/DEAH box helicase [Pirellulales bacterium]
MSFAHPQSLTAHPSRWSIDPVKGLRWEASGSPDVRDWDLAARVEPASSAWSDQFDGFGPIDMVAVPLTTPRPRVVSVPITRSPVPRTRSFHFLEPAEDEPVGSQAAGAPGPAVFHGPAADGRQAIRIRPPGDVIKLLDRLNYLLQPPLEILLAERSFGFRFEPFHYQFEGIAFLYPRQTAILADEMGLGKTMQAITAVRLLIHRREAQRVLLVCPKSLVTNWRREFDLWAPEIPVSVIEGNQAKRDWQWRLVDVPVKIANYELLNRDRNTLAGDDPALSFDLVILDESQRIKNRHSATSQVVRSLRARRRWALTGTPVENSPEDLVGIFEFLSPGYLSPEMRPRRMGRAVSDYVLRRTKEAVLADLPPKLFRDAELELSPEQHAAYQLAEGEGVVHLNELGERMTIQHVFELILRLKQICNFDPATGASTKLERLEADLEEVADSGRKAIVFSQWVETLQRLRDVLGRFGPLEYHGRIPAKHRDGVIRRFRDDPDAHVLLLSYGAGGVGLNLQFAGYVFLFDRWWNPAVEDQAINRVHRIGSAGPVTVTRMLTLGTIEERINRILEEKRELFDTIFSDLRPGRRLSLTQEEVLGLFDLSAPAPRARPSAA